MVNRSTTSEPFTVNPLAYSRCPLIEMVPGFKLPEGARKAAPAAWIELPVIVVAGATPGCSASRSVKLLPFSGIASILVDHLAHLGIHGLDVCLGRRHRHLLAPLPKRRWYPPPGAFAGTSGIPRFDLDIVSPDSQLRKCVKPDGVCDGHLAEVGSRIDHRDPRARSGQTVGIGYRSGDTTALAGWQSTAAEQRQEPCGNKAI